MKKYFFKYETIITILLIIFYLVTNSYCMQNYGLTDLRSALCNLVLSLIILIFIKINKLDGYYGLNKFSINKKNLYYIPLILIIFTNLFNGINVNNTINEILIHTLLMVGVGFLEEIIFRGFLYKMMEKDNIKMASFVTSITFGIGHILNLFNGSSLIPTLIQIVCAISIGFLFVTILQKEKSLYPCIITHISINSLSIFNNSNNVISLYIGPSVLFITSVLYTIYLKKLDE